LLQYETAPSNKCSDEGSGGGGLSAGGPTHPFPPPPNNNDKSHVRERIRGHKADRKGPVGIAPTPAWDKPATWKTKGKGKAHDAPVEEKVNSEEVADFAESQPLADLKKMMDGQQKRKMQPPTMQEAATEPAAVSARERPIKPVSSFSNYLENLPAQRSGHTVKADCGNGVDETRPAAISKDHVAGGRTIHPFAASLSAADANAVAEGTTTKGTDSAGAKGNVGIELVSIVRCYFRY
jgi:hypothetical protein